jgi:hypothetical protein
MADPNVIDLLASRAYAERQFDRIRILEVSFAASRVVTPPFLRVALWIRSGNQLSDIPREWLLGLRCGVRDDLIGMTCSAAVAFATRKVDVNGVHFMLETRALLPVFSATLLTEQTLIEVVGPGGTRTARNLGEVLKPGRESIA